MKKMVLLILISLLFVSCQPVIYQEHEEYELSTEVERMLFYHAKLEGAYWKYFFKMGAGTTVYYDTENIVQKGDTQLVWTKFKHPQGYTIVFNSINCNEEKIRHTQSIAYSEKGMPKLRSYHSSEWKFIVPKTLSDELRKVVCR